MLETVMYLKCFQLFFDFFDTDAMERKKNFQRLKQLVLIGGPDDNIITPWQSA